MTLHLLTMLIGWVKYAGLPLTHLLPLKHKTKVALKNLTLIHKILFNPVYYSLSKSN